MKRYSEMTVEDIQQAIIQLEQEHKEAIGDGWQSKADMIARKIDMAKSYLLDPETFEPGLYHVHGHDQLFKLEYMNGVMAWGSMGHEQDLSFPISMLTPSEQA